MLAHIFDDVLDSDVDSVFDDALIQVPDDVLDHSELLEEFSPRVKNFMREDVLLSIDPQIRESFLGRVQNFRQITQTSFLVQHFVCF